MADLKKQEKFQRPARVGDQWVIRLVNGRGAACRRPSGEWVASHRALCVSIIVHDPDKIAELNALVEAEEARLQEEKA